MKLILAIFFFGCQLFFAQVLEQVDFDVIEKNETTKQRPIIIRVYADWCNICKIEMFEIKKEDNLVKLINDKFYFVNFNSEKTKKSLIFNGRKFNYIPNGNLGIHQLALELSLNKEKLVYPFWVFLNSDQSFQYYHEGRLKPDELKQIIGQLK